VARSGSNNARTHISFYELTPPAAAAAAASLVHLRLYRKLMFACGPPLQGSTPTSLSTIVSSSCSPRPPQFHLQPTLFACCRNPAGSTSCAGCCCGWQDPFIQPHPAFSGSSSLRSPHVLLRTSPAVHLQGGDPVTQVLVKE
jgi:hypothetical protein